MHYEEQRTMNNLVSEGNEIIMKLQHAQNIKEIATLAGLTLELYKKMPTTRDDVDRRPLFDVHVKLFGLIAEKLESLAT